MIANNPQPIALKDPKSPDIKQKIINDFDDLVLAVVLDGFADPEESLPDSKRRIYKAAKIQPQWIWVFVFNQVIVVFLGLAVKKWSRES